MSRVSGLCRARVPWAADLVGARSAIGRGCSNALAAGYPRPARQRRAATSNARALSMVRAGLRRSLCQEDRARKRSPGRRLRVQPHVWPLSRRLKVRQSRFFGRLLPDPVRSRAAYDGPLPFRMVDSWSRRNVRIATDDPMSRSTKRRPIPGVRWPGPETPSRTQRTSAWTEMSLLWPGSARARGGRRLIGRVPSRQRRRLRRCSS